LGLEVGTVPGALPPLPLQEGMMMMMMVMVMVMVMVTAVPTRVAGALRLGSPAPGRRGCWSRTRCTTRCTG
jgi:hypothetical protein